MGALTLREAGNIINAPRDPKAVEVKIKHSVKLQPGFLRFVLPVCLLLAAAVPKMHAATATWTNYVTTLSDYWTNSVNWNPVTVPGATANNDAHMTNDVALTYTNILNFGLSAAIRTNSLVNPSGEAWLVVTNNAAGTGVNLTNTVFVLNSGGRLQIDSGAVVTGITTFTWLGTNGAIYLNNGGKLFTAAAVTIGNGISNVQATVSSLSPTGQGGTWNYLGLGLTVGSGASTGTVLNVTGGILTNTGVVTVGSGTASAFNRMTVTNATLFSTGLAVGSNSSNNQLSVLSGATWNMLNNAGTIGGIGAAATGNVLMINGGTLTNLNLLYVGNGGAKQNSLVLTNGGKLFLTLDLTVGGNGLNHSNSATIGGVGAEVTLSASRNIVVGMAGGASGNTLTVTNAKVFGILHVGGRGDFGAGNAVTNNTVILYTNTVWNNNGGTLTIGGAPSSISNSLVINGGVLTNVSSGGVSVIGHNQAVPGSPTFGNSLTVSNGGRLYIPGGLTVGNYAGASNNAYNVGGLGAMSTVSHQGITVGNSGGSGNTLTVTNAYMFAGGTGQLNIGWGSSTNNSVSVLADGTLNLANSYIYIGFSGSSPFNNQMIVNGGTVTNVNTVALGQSVAGYNGSLTISNNGKFFGGAVYVGNTAGSTNNSYNVGGFGLPSFASNQLISVGAVANANNNRLTVTNATLLSGATTIGNGSSSNTVTVLSDATWNLLAGNLTVGSGTATGNVLTINGGGVLEASGLVTGTGAGNLITNFGGVFQFTTATPTINTNGNAGGSIFLSGGTIAFRNVSSGLNLTNNTDTARLGRLTYSGDNTLRLNNSTATNTVVGGYTFQTGGAFNNYNRLEMIGATNAITGTGVTIGSGGSFLASNTVATFSGVFTNHSANARLIDSAVNFTNGLHVAGTLSLVNSYVKGGGTKTIDGSGRIEGNGTIVGDATVSGVIAPGFGPGTLVFSNNLTLAGSYQADFGDGGNDQLIVVGDLTLTGATLDLTVGGGLTGAAYVIASYGDLFGTFSVTNGMPVGYTLDYNYNSANQIAIVVIPEPGPLALVVFGLVALGTITHYRRARL
ncbi:MAG: hypothetical protein PCFJNLEI_00650 [Verrucomicrobiae bacterium]|nr:hypothetical protein [Verrucomicrobiae bacterium]